MGATRRWRAWLYEHKPVVKAGLLGMTLLAIWSVGGGMKAVFVVALVLALVAFATHPRRPTGARERGGGTADEGRWLKADVISEELDPSFAGGLAVLRSSTTASPTSLLHASPAR